MTRTSRVPRRAVRARRFGRDDLPHDRGPGRRHRPRRTRGRHSPSRGTGARVGPSRCPRPGPRGIGGESAGHQPERDAGDHALGEGEAPDVQARLRFPPAAPLGNIAARGTPPVVRIRRSRPADGNPKPCAITSSPSPRPWPAPAADDSCTSTPPPPGPDCSPPPTTTWPALHHSDPSDPPAHPDRPTTSSRGRRRPPESEIPAPVTPRCKNHPITAAPAPNDPAPEPDARSGPALPRRSRNLDCGCLSRSRAGW